jgi:hypothetical protein
MQPISRLHLFRLCDPRTGQVHASGGGSDEAIATTAALETARRHPGVHIQVYQSGTWRPWLRLIRT